MITLCVPTRGRPKRFAKMLNSALATADEEIEVSVRFDKDDLTVSDYPQHPSMISTVGKQKLIEDIPRMSGYWDEAWRARRLGTIAMLCADDVVFETPGWDRRVEETFLKFPDRIGMVYARPNDDERPLLPFVSREWVDAVGLFTPDDLQGWFSDEWIWSMAAEIGRVIYLEDVRITHDQFSEMDDTYLDAIKARDMMGGLKGMRKNFYSVAQVHRRDELIAKLRSAMTSSYETIPRPTPKWVTDSLDLAAAAREHQRKIREDTLIAVHCYSGDRDVVKRHMPLYLHHGAPVVVLSPEDAPVRFRRKGVQCRFGGKAAYYGQKSLDRQRKHLEILLDYPQRYFLLNDADSFCLDPVIPSYVYERADRGFVLSNEVMDWRPHSSPYPKIAMHPPYFLTRESIERMLKISFVDAHPITPYIDWYMLALVCEAGLGHANYPDGRSFPAWRWTNIPETKLLGHDYKHKDDPDGTTHGDDSMAWDVGRGTIFIHSVKHAHVYQRLVREHRAYVRRGAPPANTLSIDEYVQLQQKTEAIHEQVTGGFHFGDTVRV